MTAVTESDEVFRLFDLPPELWVRIARLALDDKPKIRAWPKNPQMGTYEQILTQPAITRTCHALRVEILPLFYESHIRFRFYDGLDGGRTKQSQRRVWLRAIGAANRRCLKNIELLAVPEDMVGRQDDKVYNNWMTPSNFLKDLEFDVELGTPIKDTYGGAETEKAIDGEMVYPFIFK
ncbi:hypothetical protein LTR56_000118 [Elasticomyces elasticus]|nr:hypothetical protein LTR56_000118 [Elasticomyces elasticus]KAK3667106.1 hypothetical protein LTR22_001970 [Elasticomyces elasticus]KAK4932881.1 hypothetical protein LTR49_000837 [Elasticomyces elasticus]KAK5768715.1 hypothetical protein LTS12_001141 [Elasticomyces elasticus]